MSILTSNWISVYQFRNRSTKHLIRKGDTATLCGKDIQGSLGIFDTYEEEIPRICIKCNECKSHLIKLYFGKL